MTYHNEARTHLSLNKDAPVPRAKFKVSDGLLRSLISVVCITNMCGSDLR
jgi:hypothetical protein